MASWLASVRRRRSLPPGRGTPDSPGRAPPPIPAFGPTRTLGRYQRRALLLAAGSYAVDNMWLQGIAAAIPRVSDEWLLTPIQVARLSSATFTGMTLGAFGWGLYADARGRVSAWTGALLVASAGGLACTVAPTFSVLCLTALLAGTGVGGSLPVSGTLAAETISSDDTCLKGMHDSLLPSLSAAFGIGGVLAALAAAAILPPLSCTTDSVPNDAPCTRALNIGWRVLLGTLAGLVGLLAFARSVGWPLYEPPVALVARGCNLEASQVRMSIAAYNTGSSTVESSAGDAEQDAEEGDQTETAEAHEAHFATAPSTLWGTVKSAMEQLFAPAWRRLTLLLCCVHAMVNLGFTSFNVFLPALLELLDGGSKATGNLPLSLEKTRSSSSDLRSTLLGWLLASLGGIAGSFSGAWMSGQPRWGRVGTLILSCLVAALSIVLTALGPFPVLFSTVASLASASAYAALYSYTAEVYHPSIRGFGGGVAMACSRAAGIVAPLLSGALVPKEGGMTPAPLYLAALVLAACAAGPAYALPYETLSKAASEDADEQGTYLTLPQDS